MCIGEPMSGKTEAIKLLVMTLKALHAQEILQKTNIFMQKKAQMQEIDTVMERGMVRPMIDDPILDAKIKVKPEEQ